MLSEKCQTQKGSECMMPIYVTFQKMQTNLQCQKASKWLPEARSWGDT